MSHGTLLRRAALPALLSLTWLAACGSDATGPGDGGLGEPSDTILLADADTLIDGDGYVWDIYWQYASPNNGSSDAYDGGHRIVVESTFLQVADSMAYVYDDSTEWWMQLDTVSGIATTRRIYVPTDAAYARFLDILENTSDSAVVVDVQIYTNLGSDSGTQLIATSDLDANWETTDTWIVTDDASNGSGDPTLVHVSQGPGASVPVSAVTGGAGLNTMSFTYSVPLAANGGRAILMHFGSQNLNQTAAIAKAGFLSTLGAGTLANMSSQDLAEVVNWDLVP